MFPKSVGLISFVLLGMRPYGTFENATSVHLFFCISVNHWEQPLASYWRDPRIMLLFINSIFTVYKD